MNIQSLCHSESVSAITFVKCPISHQGEKDKLRGLCDSTSNKLSRGEDVLSMGVDAVGQDGGLGWGIL